MAAGWNDGVGLPPFAQVASLEPTLAGPGGVAPDTSFRLSSLDGTQAAELARLLVARPAVSFEVTSIAGSTAIVHPTRPLRPDTLYRISLVRPDGTTLGSWATQAAGPLAVTGTIPGDHATGVPLDTGVELSFNQLGVRPEDLGGYFSITPAVAGRFEAAGRLLAFVPDTRLRAGTVYTVTVRRGLPLPGTGQVLATDKVFRFETAAPHEPVTAVSFATALVETGTADKPAVAVSIDLPFDENGDQVGKPPASLPVTVHRLAGLDAGIAAYRAVLDIPEWTLVSNSSPVATTGLERVFNGTVRLRKFGEDVEGARWLQLPVRLAAGWYVITETFGSDPHQAVLQVTDIATFTLAASDRTAIWVNDLDTRAAAAGADVAVDGRRLGATDARGLLLAATPLAEATPRSRVEEDGSEDEALVVVRYRDQAAFRPTPAVTRCPECGSDTGEAWWQLLSTDRGTYRATDTVNAWGAVRSRDTGRVPASVSLTVYADDGDVDPAPITSASATPDRMGAFAARLQVRDLPVGDYRILLTSDGTQLGEAWFSVATITKPGWEIKFDTARHAVVAGRSVKALVQARFFEGTPVAGTEVAFTGDEERRVVARTDAAGDATASVRMRISQYSDQWTVETLSVRPTLPEEAAIAAETDVAVFRSTNLLAATASLNGTRLAVGGEVNKVAFARFEKPGVSPWDVDPKGAGIPGARVRLTITEQTHYTVQTGTQYDFVAKRMVPQYEDRTRDRVVETRTVRTDRGGKYAVGIAVRGGRNRSYSIEAAYTDAAGRTLHDEAYAEPVSTDEESSGPSMECIDTRCGDGYSVGDTVRVRFNAATAEAPVERFLFATASEGLLNATVGGSATFRTTFSAEAVPTLWISGARFNGLGYEVVVDGLSAALDLDDRRISVELSSDRPRYEPGDTATVAVRTRGPDGKPVAASVFVRAIDEKLYAIGAVEDADPVYGLYAYPGSGILGASRSHETPLEVVEGECGLYGCDTMGGDGDEAGRDDFRDWLVGTIVRSGADGRASLPIPISDDLTSWRVTGMAVDGAFDAGIGSTSFQVGLPFFAEVALASRYLVADRPTIRVRSFGGGLEAGEQVRFTISSDTLPMAATIVTADAFEAAEAALPALTTGLHHLRVQAAVGSGAGRRTDTITRTFTVVQTQATLTRTTWAPLAGSTAVAAGAGFTRLVLADAGRGRVVPVLESLAGGEGVRADRILAAGLSARVLAEDFRLEDVEPVDETALDPFLLGDSDDGEGEGGLTLVSYGAADLDVTALAAMAGDPRVAPSDLSSYLRSVADADAWADGEGAVPERRDRRLLALAGLAALGEPVLPDLHAAAALRDLSVAETISVALGALNAGDESLASQLERRVLRDHGSRRGHLVRVNAGEGEDASVQTARLAIVAASLGDPVAAEMDAYLEANPPAATLVDLERALAARGWATRTTGGTARAALTVSGHRQVIELDGGGAATITLTPAQAATARVEPVEGSVVLVQTVDVPLARSSLETPAGVELGRSMKPSGVIRPTDPVIVTIKVTLQGTEAREDAWRVVDLVPSGLAPIAGGAYRYDEEEEEYVPAGWVQPDSIDGQRVVFSFGGNRKRGTYTLRYAARVVTPGTYRWEPAVLQSETAPSEGLVTRDSSVRILGIGH